MNKRMEALNISEININDDMTKEFCNGWMIYHAPERKRKKNLAEKICKDLKHISHLIKAEPENVELGLLLELDKLNEKFKSSVSSKSSISSHAWNIGEASTSATGEAFTSGGWGDVVLLDTDFQMLEPRQWLNDTHMDFYLNI
ncbi:putative papain-like cysteine peptidase superfamily [Helianthus annuus]|nr:putative papain-like cysteine peptidase superfamily [Helianthus annuus]KAJ0552168.1 putative papain-like cysteine peptidase superfamily [Helianthus annuus]KAJ0717872.1 putative papain-like cysteine peptidase superfamily [Helianthus annuus]KAJ0721109.1 putative papain-like cysteine peptidase superfamily [Helianthus annuus]